MSLRPSRARRLLCALMVGIALLSGCMSPLSPAPAKVYRVGWLSGRTEAESTLTDVLRQALRELGYVEGLNLSLEARYADARAERYTAIAAEFVALKLDVIVVRAGPGVLALKQATTSIPIVLAAGIIDPVADGLVASLARPGGNITGTIDAGPELAQRRLQLLKEAAPAASRVAYLLDASNPAQVRGYQEARSAAAVLGIELLPFEVRSPEEVADALAAAGRAHPDAFVVGGNTGGLIGQQSRILDFLAASRLPSMISSNRTWVDHGALLYYDEDEVEAFKRAAGYVDRILKGANPADLPIQQATKFDLIINLKTAQALGLTIPKSVLDQATEFIQ